jgi:hypothetical protein
MLEVVGPETLVVQAKAVTPVTHDFMQIPNQGKLRKTAVHKVEVR